MTKTTDSDTEVSANPSTTPAGVPRTIFLKFFNGLLSDSSGFLPCPPDCNVKLLTSITRRSSYTGFGCMVVCDMESRFDMVTIASAAGVAVAHEVKKTAKEILPEDETERRR